MKIMHLNTSDRLGGAARAANRLHQGLKNLGISSILLVQSKTSDNDDILLSGSRLSKGLGLKGLRPHLDNLPVELYRKRRKTDWDTGWLPGDTIKQIKKHNPDIIHLHWICSGFVPIQELARFNKPIVWTLHDSWPFTGGCHVPFECRRYEFTCGRCPQLKSRTIHDLSSWILARKKRYWKKLKMVIVAPSSWLGNCAKNSAVFKTKPLWIIPNGLDPTLYRPIRADICREILKIPKDKAIILFGAVKASEDSNKGLAILINALKYLVRKGWKDKICLLIAGTESNHIVQDLGIETTCYGFLQDELSLVLLYCAADIFVLPSILENLPTMVMESMACGTPTIGFRSGGTIDLIEHGQNGYLAKPNECEDLANGMIFLLSDEDRRKQMALNARKKIIDNFDRNHVARRYFDVYKQLLRTET